MSAADTETTEPVARERVNRRKWQDALKGPHGLKPEVHHVALALLLWMNEEGICWPGQDTIAAVVGKRERAVRDGLKGLESAGWIERKRGGRHGDQAVSSRYFATLPTGSRAPVGPHQETVPNRRPDAGRDNQTVGFPAGTQDPNRQQDVPQPAAQRLPTGSRLPTNSQENSQKNTQENPPPLRGRGDARVTPQLDTGEPLTAEQNAERVQQAKALLRSQTGEDPY
jgi:hypothetical protein